MYRPTIMAVHAVRCALQVLTQSTGDRLFLRPLTVDKLVEEIPNS
jgi:hypothetical protein